MSYQNLSARDTFREIFDQAPVGMAHVSLEGKWLEVNRRLCEMTGYSRDELLAASWQKITHPDDLPGNLEMNARVSAGDFEDYCLEKRYIRKDGRTIWVKISVSLVRDESTRKPQYLITAIEEITEYKHAQELLVKSEEKWAKAFRQSTTAMLVSSWKDYRCLEVNEAFERFTGYNRSEAIGRTSIDLNVWVEPARRQEIIDTIRAGGRVEGMENSYRRKDGSIFIGLTFVDKIDVDGEPCLIWAVSDITDRKRLEAELQELSGRLIESQDLERKEIATELNDSLGQSITVLSYEACQLARITPGELGTRLQSLCSKIQDIATGIGMISQGLHPSGLDYTGLQWAIQGLCRQFMHVHGLEVAFRHEQIPVSLSFEVSVCIYRIVQEGLRNVILHSNSKQAWIDLVNEGTTIRLELWDNGVGFDIGSTKAGLGLLTMRERCRRLNGSLAIHNGKGVRIEVHIPLGNVETSRFPILPANE